MCSSDLKMITLLILLALVALPILLKMVIQQVRIRRQISLKIQELVTRKDRLETQISLLKEVNLAGSQLLEQLEQDQINQTALLKIPAQPANPNQLHKPAQPRSKKQRPQTQPAQVNPAKPAQPQAKPQEDPLLDKQLVRVQVVIQLLKTGLTLAEAHKAADKMLNQKGE